MVFVDRMKPVFPGQDLESIYPNKKFRKYSPQHFSAKIYLNNRQLQKKSSSDPRSLASKV